MENNQRNPTWGERLDRIISFFNPSAGLRRMTARAQMRFAQGYEAAAPWRNSANWFPADGRAEGINRHGRQFLRAKARYLERNNEIVNSVLNAYTRNTVGKGFNLQVKTDNADWNSLIEKVWREWCKPGNCDVTGQYSLTEILNMIVRRKIVDGGSLLVKTLDKKAKIPFQLQLREVDDIDAFGQIKSPAGNPIVDGIEVNEYGKPLTYYLRKYDFVTLAQIESERIPAERVYFLFEKVRPSQVREITPLARTIEKVNDLDEYFSTALFNEKINSAVAVYITSNNVAAGAGIGRGGAGTGTGPGSKQLPPRIDAGSVKYLQPGEDVKTLVPSGQASELETFNLALMQQISAGQGLSYEQVTRDVSRVNYSSARQNLLEDWKVFAAEQKFLIDHFLDSVLREVIMSAILKGYIPAREVPAGFWDDPDEFLKHEFIGPTMPWIDPYKEALANQIMLDSYQMTLQEYCAKTGRDYEEVMKQITAESELKRKIAETLTPPQKGDGDGDAGKSAGNPAKSDV